MAVTLSLFAGVGAQFFDNNGVPLSGGKIFTYAAGTTTPLAAYTSNIGNVAHTNPIILDSAGRVPSGEIWLTTGVGYKFVVSTSTGVLIATYDNIPSSAQPPAANDADSIFYEQGSVVTAGSFIVGQTYRILTVGTTNFTLIGATSNTVGLHFIATGVGTGDGTAERSQTVETKLRQTVSVKDFGAVGDGVTDDTAAIQAAVDYASANFGDVYFPPGNYILSNTIISQPVVENKPCAKLIGSGVDNTTLTATHSNGPVVTIRGFFSGVTNLTIDANASRESGAAGTNYGILHHPPDTASGQAKFAVYEQIEIRNQPSHAIVFCATWVGSRISEFEINNCGGHGIVMDDGTILSRTNLIRCGGIDIVNGQINDCVGHAILAGDDQVPGVNEAFRINIQNIDIFRCATSAGVRLEPYSCWLFMRNSTVTLCAFGGFVGSPFVPTIGGIWVAGESVTLNNNRFVTVLDTAISINRKSSFQSVIINEITVLGTNQPVLNPAILINAGVENVAIQQQSDTNITTLSSALPINSYSIFKGIFTTTSSMQASSLQPTTGFKTGSSIVISDDSVATLDFTAGARGVLVVSGSTAAAQAAVIHFRVGTSESSTILSATSNVDVTTGVLTGTTGVNGKLTISAATDNKIYIENRLGSEFSYQLTLLSLAGTGVLV